MCGIFGWIIRSEQCPGPDKLKSLTDLLLHRGPDGGNYEIRHTNDDRFSIAFGHRRLSIIDMSANGAQPMRMYDGRISIIFNGEIYNYIELRQELEALGEVFATSSDTEVLVSAYKVWGQEAIRRFRGMFAFALHDRRDDSVLFARDPFGKKPLFLAERPGGIVFGSEILPIIEAPGVDRSFNAHVLDDYLLDRYVPGPDTFFAGVRKLAPGSMAVWRAGRIETTQYYTPPIATTVPDLTDYAEAVRLFREAFDDSVRIRMRSDAPFGAFLSGGLDSSATVGVMARYSAGPVRTFSVGFEETAFSELQHCRYVADTFATRHHELVVTQDSFFRNWEAAILHRGAPVSEASDIPIMLLSQAASAEVKMVLTGEGADEFFAGYPKHVAEHYLRSYQRIVPSGLHDGLVRPAVDRLPYGMRRLKVLAKALGERNPADRVRIWFGGLSRDDKDALLGVRKHGRERHDAPFPSGASSNLRRSQYFDQVSWLPDNTLERNDRMMMAGSIEGRMPFMDTQLAQLAARMPDNFLVRGFRGKSVVRKAMEGLVPARILRRRKNGFRVPINEWFRTTQRDLVRDLLVSESSRIRRILNGELVDRIVSEHMQSQVNHERMLWSLCNLEQFLRAYRLEPEAELRGTP